MYVACRGRKMENARYTNRLSELVHGQYLEVFSYASRSSRKKNYLLETDLGGTLTEALTAEVQSVLADQTGLVGADTAVKEYFVSISTYRVEFRMFKRRTIGGSPCRTRGGGCTKQTRAT